jgi:hypothetical protein
MLAARFQISVATTTQGAQDMGSEAFRLIRAIVPKRDPDANSLFLVGDAHQRIYRRKASLKACGVDVQGRSRRLKVNYRTSDTRGRPWRRPMPRRIARRARAVAKGTARALMSAEGFSGS